MIYFANIYTILFNVVNVFLFTFSAVKIIEPQRDLFGNIENSQLSLTFNTKLVEGKLSDKINEYFFVNSLEVKKQLKNEINQIVHEHIKDNLKMRENSLYRQIAEAEVATKLSALGTKQLKALKEQYEKLTQSTKLLHEIQDKNERPYFLWNLYFKDVFEQGGFDIVIGNPPYINFSKNKELGAFYKNKGFECFNSNGDIYSLFYEKGIQLLKHLGHLCFITSNKWMRTSSGESTRNFFVEQVNPILLVDLGPNIFESATVDVNILILQNNKNQQKIAACAIKKEEKKCIKELSVFVRQNATTCNFGTESWVVLSPIEQRIKAKIEAVGTPLKDWDINIYRGILTGYNEAFIIDGKKKDELIAEDPKSEEIIRPILRGRDIKRYGYEFADLWLINTHIRLARHLVLHRSCHLNKNVLTNFAHHYPLHLLHQYSHLLFVLVLLKCINLPLKE